MPEIKRRRSRLEVAAEKAALQAKLDVKLHRMVIDRNQPLPLLVVSDKPHEVFIRQCAMLCTAAAKKVAICTLNGQSQNLDETIESILLQVWNNGYNSGLKDMDQMHGV